MRKLYLFFITFLFVAVANAQDYKVMIVSQLLPAEDITIQDFMNKIDSMPGIAATHVPMANLPTTTYTDYDAAIITENGGSGSMQAFGSAGWPIPAVHLKAYALYQGTYPLFTDANWYTTDRPTDMHPGINQLVVKENSDILKCFKIDSVVTWTGGYNLTAPLGSGEAHVQAFNLKDVATTNAAVVPAATLLATNPYLDSDPNATIKTFMWKIEENTYTKRLVTWGVHHTFLQQATNDFWSIIKNSLLWVIKKEADISCGGVEGFKDLTTPNFRIYPNPVVDKLNINSAGLISSINVIDITGKTIMKIYDVNNQHAEIDMNSLPKGLYVIHLTTVNGETYAGKISK